MTETGSPPRFPSHRLQAVIFDMDGVVTRTARLHAAAWKEMFDAYLKDREGEDFHPFDEDREYRKYVDGKPRYDGVQSFLESRGISLDRGDPGDPPDRETVCGLGNRKNRIFRRMLEERGAETYPGALDFIAALRSRGLKVAVISASRNAEAVLTSAGVLDRFDVKVDGVDSDDLDLAGKPAPDIFEEAARRLGVEPSRAAVVEDAQAGVEAGRRGGFGLVVGVDRSGQAGALREHGAAVVVPALDVFRFEDEAEAPAPAGDSDPGTPISKLPSPLDDPGALDAALDRAPPAVFLDYDGTLTPIVDDPEAANLSEAARATVKRLAGLCPVAVVSGRDLDDVRKHVALDGIWYAGSHGFDLRSPEGESHQHEAGKRALPGLDRAGEALRGPVEEVEGARLERKRFALAVHFRRVRDPEGEAALEKAVDATAAIEPELRKTGGKKIFELRPAADWDKGKAVLWLLKALGLEAGSVTPIYLGDDETDEDAFAALPDPGFGVVVGRGKRPSRARFALPDPEAARLFLDALADRLEGGSR